jgi:hypothetical protein
MNNWLRCHRDARRHLITVDKPVGITTSSHDMMGPPGFIDFEDRAMSSDVTLPVPSFHYLVATLPSDAQDGLIVEVFASLPDDIIYFDSSDKITEGRDFFNQLD